MVENFTQLENERKQRHLFGQTVVHDCGKERLFLHWYELHNRTLRREYSTNANRRSARLHSK